MENPEANFTSSGNFVEKLTFSWYDYILFTVVLAASAVIGIYFGCFGSKQKSAAEYLMGSKKLKVLPVAISLISSHASGVTLLALPADIYKFGGSFWLLLPALVLVGLATLYVFLPVFYKLQITTTYEYLERRFDTRTRLLASFLFVLSLLLYLPIVIYIPALAFSSATGINVHLVTIVVSGTCIFYTTIGGAKAVIWTDTLQFVITIGSILTVFVLGLVSAGGFGNVWSINSRGGRLDIFDFDPDLTKRDSFWITLPGLAGQWLYMVCLRQNCVQKLLSVPSFGKAKMYLIHPSGSLVTDFCNCEFYFCRIGRIQKKSFIMERNARKRVLWRITIVGLCSKMFIENICDALSLVCFVLGLMTVNAFCITTGMLIYARYADCDPFARKAITRNDELLPHYVMDVGSQIPGLSGLFIAGIFCAALSTLSVCLNSAAGAIYEDFVKKFIRQTPGVNRRGAAAWWSEPDKILKAIVVVFGTACTAMILVIEHLGGMLPLTVALLGAVAGPLVAMFALAVLFPRATGRGAFYGGLIGIVFISWIVVTAAYYQFQGVVLYEPKVTSVDGCSNGTIVKEFIVTLKPEGTTPSFIKPNKIFVLFRISFYLYCPLSFFVSLICGLVISFFDKEKACPIHKDLLSPVIYPLLKKTTGEDDVRYYGVREATNKVENSK